MRVVRLKIENYRGIQAADLKFDGHALLVGSNNVGKSTVCEALDLVLGPDRLNRFPPIEEYDFYNGVYLQPAQTEGEAPVPVKLRVEDLDIFAVTGLGHPKTGQAPPDQHGRWAQKVKELSIVRFGSNVRRQIGSVVRTLPADSVFHVRDGNGSRKVKAADLKAGMVLRTGEKVYW